MQAAAWPAARGKSWLIAGFYLYRRNPPLLSALTLSYLMILQIAVLLLPRVGLVLVPLVLPCMVLLVGNGARLAEQFSRRIPLAGLFFGIRNNGLIMLRLGLLYLFGITLLISLLALLPIAPSEDGAGLQIQIDTDLLQFAGRIALYFVFSLPLLMASYFAPYLAGWDRVTALQALFFSFIACLRNLRPLALWLLLAAGLGIGLPALLILLANAVSPTALMMTTFIVRMLDMFLLAPALAASAFAAYRDIFHPQPHTHAVV